MAMSKVKKRNIRLGGLGCLLLVIILNYVEIIKLNSENNKLQNHLEQIEKQLVEIQEEEVLNLRCSGKNIIVDTTNGISKADLSSFTVNSSYPIVVYQVVGKDNKILQNDLREFDNSKKINNIVIQNLNEDLTEIRIVGCNKEGKQLESRVYKFVFLK